MTNRSIAIERVESEKLFEQARRLIPGGVNSPVRSFASVGGTPVYFTRGSGSTLYDVDGNSYLDLCGSWGPLILGHAHPAVVEALSQAAMEGLTFGACCPREVEMAELILSRIPCVGMIRMVNSGTEAVMTALRLARGFTGRSKVLKFEGCYHGHSDSLLVSAGSGLLTSGVASSAGISETVAADTLVAPYNDLEAVRSLLNANAGKVAAVILEPVAGNMGLVLPKDGFLEGLRALCDQTGALLIFDEVITGFRFDAGSYGCAKGVRADLITLGKIIGGGMPVGAVAGRIDVMRHLAPLGKVYQAGTLSGNPVALAAGLATLRILIDESPYERIASMAKLFEDAVNESARRAGAPVRCHRLGSAFTVFFTDKTPLENLTDVKSADTQAYGEFFHFMLDRGFYLPPAQFELSFVSAAHKESDLKAAAAAADEFIHKRWGVRP